MQCDWMNAQVRDGLNIIYTHRNYAFSFSESFPDCDHNAGQYFNKADDAEASEESKSAICLKYQETKNKSHLKYL